MRNENVAGIITLAFGGAEIQKLNDKLAYYGGKNFVKNMKKVLGPELYKKYGLWVIKRFFETEAYKKMVGKGPVLPGFEDYLGLLDSREDIQQAIWGPYLKFAYKLVSLFDRLKVGNNASVDLYGFKTIDALVDWLRISSKTLFKEEFESSFGRDLSGDNTGDFILLFPDTFEESAFVGKFFDCAWCLSSDGDYYDAYKNSGFCFIVSLVNDFVCAVTFHERSFLKLDSWQVLSEAEFCDYVYDFMQMARRGSYFYMGLDSVFDYKLAIDMGKDKFFDYWTPRNKAYQDASKVYDSYCDINKSKVDRLFTSRNLFLKSDFLRACGEAEKWLKVELSNKVERAFSLYNEVIDKILDPEEDASEELDVHLTGVICNDCKKPILRAGFKYFCPNLCFDTSNKYFFDDYAANQEHEHEEEE